MDLGGNWAEGPSENQVVSVSEVSQRARAVLLLPCKCCREQVQLWVSAAVLGAHYAEFVVSAFPFSLLSRPGRMTPSPSFKSVTLLC